MISIIGGTGTIGTALVRDLIQGGHPTRVVARDPDKAQRLFEGAVEVVRGDLDDPASIRAAAAGSDRLFLLVSPGPEMPTREGDAVGAAVDAGVGHIVYLSALGTGPDATINLGRWHWASEEAVRSSGLDYTILRPGSFMQNYLSHAETVKQQGAFYDTHTDAPMALIDARDIAAVAHAALTQDGHAGRVYSLTGGEAVSNADIAEIFTDELGTPVRAVEVSKAQAREGMAAGGLPDWLIDDLLVLADVQRAGHTADLSPFVAEILGRAPLTFRDFARDYRTAFAG